MVITVIKSGDEMIFSYLIRLLVAGAIMTPSMGSVIVQPVREPDGQAGKNVMIQDRPILVTWEKPKFTQDGGEVPEWGSGTSAPDGSSYTILFNKLAYPIPESAALQSPVFEVTVDHKVAEGRAIAGYTTGLRGYVSKSPDTRLSVQIEVQGVRRVLIYPYGRSIDKTVFYQTRSSNVSKSELVYTTRITVQAQSRNSKPAAFLVQVDSLDITPSILTRKATP